MTADRLEAAVDDALTADASIASAEVEQLIRRGERSPSARTQAAARRCRTALDDLRRRVVDEEATRQIKNEIHALERQLAEAKTKLHQARAKNRPTRQPRPAGVQPAKRGSRRYRPGVDYVPAQVRTYANQHGLACPARGAYLPDELVQAFLDTKQA